MQLKSTAPLMFVVEGRTGKPFTRKLFTIAVVVALTNRRSHHFRQRDSHIPECKPHSQSGGHLTSNPFNPTSTANQIPNMANDEYDVSLKSTNHLYRRIFALTFMVDSSFSKVFLPFFY